MKVPCNVAVAVLTSATILHAQSALGNRASVSVVLEPSASAAPLAGRLLVLMSSNPEPLDVITPGFGADAEKVWIAAREVKHWRPGETVHIDIDEMAFPKPLSSAPEASYQLMAMLDVDRNAAYTPLSAGDVRSRVRTLERSRVGHIPIELRLTERVNEEPLTLAVGQEFIDFVSPSLSGFWGRPIHMRGIVILPPTYAHTRKRYPTIYYTHGFGARMTNLAQAANTFASRMAEGQLPPTIWVLLDESFPSGTHEFADSVNNGPWGHALTTELIPALERKYRMDAKPSGRFLNGHSSGGWAALWLQVIYSELFGGTWPTAPDPVDFRDFTNVNLYADQNVYAVNGQPVPLIRESGRTSQYFHQFVRQELVLGEKGGQMSSFEWVFSPRGPDGRPLLLFDRATGDIDPDIVQYWRRFDIAEILTSRARDLVPKLRGKIHIIVGTEDTIHLDEPVRLLEQRIKGLGYDAKFTYLEGRTHFDLYTGGLMTRITQQMYAVARPKDKWTPKKPPDAATELTK